MPVWLVTYVYRAKSYQVLVNGVTGKIAGERPWSWIKITLLVLVILIVLYVYVQFIGDPKGSPTTPSRWRGTAGRPTAG